MKLNSTYAICFWLALFCAPLQPWLSFSLVLYAFGVFIGKAQTTSDRRRIEQVFE